MLADVGSVLVGLALAAAAYAVFATLWAMQRRDPRWAESAHISVYAAAGLLALALLFLLGAFLGDQFQIRYVAYHSSRALPPYLKAAAVWAGQEGSLLLWSFFQALCAALFTASVANRSSERARPLFSWATALLSLITTFFVAVTLLLSNPFARSAAVLADGYGLNPLLRHPGMIFHPPTLYVGYVGLMVPFALALAALITRRVDDWPAAAHPWALAAWLFLGLGLVLGARWAYDVLDWGGYWGWDAVENAGLLPWLTAIALLHGVVMQGERQGFRTWNLLLAVLSAVLVFAGILITRSGWIRSVHAFAPSALGHYFLAIILLTLAGSLFLLYSRRAVLAAPASSERLFSRGGMFLLTLMLLLTIAGSVLAGTLLPTLSGGRFEADPAWFERVTGPQFAALVLLMGVCPLVGRTVGALQGLRRWGLPAVLGAILLTVAAALAGFTRAVSLAGFAILGLAGSTTLAEIGRQALARSRREGERPSYALWHLFARHRRRYGGTLVHAGVILMSLGIIGTRTYAYETEARLWPGEPVEVGDYVLLYEDVRQEPAGDRLSTWVSLAVYRKGLYLTTLYPRLDQYADSAQTVAVPALRMGLREDLHVALFWSSEDGSVNVKIVVNPLMNFLWLGSLALLAGGMVALWPSLAAAHPPGQETQSVLLRNDPGP